MFDVTKVFIHVYNFAVNIKWLYVQARNWKLCKHTKYVEAKLAVANSSGQQIPPTPQLLEISDSS